MKIYLTFLILTILTFGCKKEDTKPVKVEVYGSVKHYSLGYFNDGELYMRQKNIDSGYSEVYQYSNNFKYIFSATIKDTFGYAVIKVTDGQVQYYDSIYGSPGVSVRINP